jgi:prophage antirepressor-like protein
METTMRVFTNSAFGKVRTAVKDGEPWFVAADVCRVLELDDVSNAVSRLDDDEHISLAQGHPFLNRVGGITKSNLGKPTPMINESGVYSLILGSRKPEAKPFKRWVTHDILPTIRKTGEYHAPKRLLENYRRNIEHTVNITRQLDEVYRERIDYKCRVEEQEKEIAQLKQSLDGIFSVSDFESEGLLSTSMIAEKYGYPLDDFIKILYFKRIMYRGKQTFVLYKSYADKGYTTTREYTWRNKEGIIVTEANLYWTKEGYNFLYGKLKEGKIVPLDEKK